MRLRRVVGGKVGLVVALTAAFLLGGATYGAVVISGASGADTTYYACLTTSKTLIKVGTVTPNCKNGSQLISWNSTGPQGPPGVTHSCSAGPYPGVDLVDCNLSGDNFVSASLDGANLTNSNMSSADLEYAQMYGANLLNVALGSTNMMYAVLYLADLSGSDLTNSDLTDAKLQGVNMTGAVLSGTNFTGADLNNANMTNAHLTAATIWSNTTCPDGTNSNNDGDTCANDLSPTSFDS